MVITNSSTLHGRYAIQSVLGEVGPFDVSYLAWDLQDEHEVVLREYYPLQFSKRASDGLTLEVNDPKNFEYGLGAYTAEAHRLIDISHPNVINYQANFKENGTIYSVSTYTAGASTYGYMTQQGGALSEEEALAVMSHIMSGLKTCHENNLFHGGIWPKSIHLTPDNTPILMGFSQARFQLAKQCEKFEQVHLPGFTAPEQAYKEVDAGPWWDIFGCAATLFYMLSGYQLNYQREQCTEEDIQAALHRETSISADLRPVLEKALAFNYKERFESLEGFQYAIEEATTKKTLLSMHTNGHHTNGQSYATSVSALPGVTTNNIAIDDDIIDVKEVKSLPLEKEPSEDVVADPVKETNPIQEPVPEPADNVVEEVKERPVLSVPRETITPMEKESQSPGPIADLPTNGKTNTSIIQQEPPPSPMLLTQSKPGTPAPDAPPEESEKEVAQLLSKMVRWQQTLIAFILGFVFLVLIGTLALFAGPQLMNLVKGGSSDNNADLQAAAMASAAALPLAVDDSTGETISQSDIDSLYATIRAQLEEELSSTIAAQAEAQVRSSAAAIRPEPSNIPEPRRQQGEESRSSVSTPESTEEIAEESEADTQQEEETPVQETNEDEALLAENELTEGTNELPTPEVAEQDRVDEVLRQREFQMYRTMGDSLLSQGFEGLALQWYQSALQQDPSDNYVAEQIRRIEESTSEVSTAELEADSLASLRRDVTDENGIFFAPDIPARMIDEARVHGRVRYPKSCLGQTNGGRVIARAIVDEAGTPSNLMIAKSLHQACDKEVLRVLGNALFEPAIFNGQPVKSWYAFSVVFREQ